MQAAFLDCEPTARAAHFPRRDVLDGKHGHYSVQAATNYLRVGRVVLAHFDLHTPAKYAKRCTRAAGAAVQRCAATAGFLLCCCAQG